ncbi:WXG100 family type VII secretion target [Streptomyces sp. NBC_01525]|uniref:WXG100 family type VII secretion target n=1 Tax=Streptomyces benahoarensis TaxID=2595054 RepID=A0A553Z7L9_9ACTN|nr:WXG100 family type VII secretion target [Streptomyces benahoarensis]TSB28929.1 WXG100 family type VII secretion target [Streptomyces benahoarensis]TSB37434.1 WXG100 family type VII secretion target [Streptomyces benahoarensis]
MERGADLEKLRDLSKEFHKKSAELHALVKYLDARTKSSESFWKGPKANQFRQEWDSVRPTFDTFAETLESASRSARTNADNIERAT